MADSKNQSYLHGAAILTATVAIVKVIGAIYKIPLANILGDEGYAHFSVAYTIYSLLLTVSTTGLPVALSKMVAAANALGRPMQVKRIFSVGRITFFAVGLVGFFLMFFFPEWLADAMDAPESWYSIKALAPSMLFVCLISAYRGYAQGFSNMIPTSVSQIIEAFSKLVFGLILAWWLKSYGYGLPVAAAGAIAGVSIGSVLSFAYMFFYKRRIDRAGAGVIASPDVADSRADIFKQLLKIGIPITLGASILSLINLADTKLILNRLQSAAGFSEEAATILYGVYSKVQTLYNLPAAVITPLTISAIPAIAAFLSKRNHSSATEVASSSLKITTLIALPAGVGLSVLSYPIVNVLYPGSALEGPMLLAVLGIASYFVCLVLMSNAILQAYGFERFTVYTLPIGGIIKIAINWVLVGNPDIGIYGAPIGTLACYTTIALLNIWIMKRKVPNPPKLSGIFIKPALCSLLMGAVAWLSYTVLAKLSSGLITDGIWRFSAEWLIEAVAMVGAVIVAIVVYVVLIIVLRAVTKEDVKLIPKGEKLAKILKIQ